MAYCGSLLALPPLPVVGGPLLSSRPASAGTLAFVSRGRSRHRRRIPRLSAAFPAGGDLAVAVGEDLPEDYGSWFPTKDPSKRRRAGVLLHPTSLPGPYGIGDLGDEALRFLDWLHSAGCSVWQVLPLVPPGRKSMEDGSPYAGQDANCGNTLLISLEELVRDGLLMKDELPEPIDMERVQFSTIAGIKDPLITKAAERLIFSHGELKRQLDDFRKDPGIVGWLEDAALFAAIDQNTNTFGWNEWPEPLKNRHLGALENIYHNQKTFIDIFVAQQFLFQRQWQNVRRHAHKIGIKIMGDMPIYVGYHSADVWANRKSFLLDRSGFPILVSGVPPDAFSETGQLWGSPLYDWRAMKDNGFTWWIQRIKRALDLYDEFRIDHFRGFAGYWSVPSESKIAMFGRWKAGPGRAFFDAVFKAVGKITIIAEDLGVITEDVVQLRKAIDAPGMAVLQFGFGSGSDNPHLPHNHEQDQVVYTGTHDNDTALGWWENLKHEERKRVEKYLGTVNGTNISWALIHFAVSSVARTAIFPMQDILGLGNSARMNIPATQEDRVPISFLSPVHQWGRYLGVPISYRKLRNRDLSEILEKIKHKIRSWPFNKLSMAGKITLIKSVLLSVLIHALSCTNLPIGFIQDLESPCRSFLWAQQNSKGIAWLKWDFVHDNHKQGGLNLSLQQERTGLVQHSVSHYFCSSLGYPEN